MVMSKGCIETFFGLRSWAPYFTLYFQTFIPSCLRGIGHLIAGFLQPEAENSTPSKIYSIK